MTDIPVIVDDLPRMETGSVWSSPPIQFQSGSQSAVVDITGWTIEAVATGKNASIVMNVENGKISFDAQNRLILNLFVSDCSSLGAGSVTIEILRIAPSPAPRPLGYISVTNYQGLN